MTNPKIGAFFIIAFMLTVSAACAAGGGGHESEVWTTSMLIWRVINTLALIGVLVYFLKAPMVRFFSERKAQIAKDLEDAKLQREKAEQLISEYKQKIAGMEKELEKMRSELKKEKLRQNSRTRQFHLQLN